MTVTEYCPEANLLLRGVKFSGSYLKNKEVVEDTTDNKNENCSTFAYMLHCSHRRTAVGRAAHCIHKRESKYHSIMDIT